MKKTISTILLFISLLNFMPAAWAEGSSDKAEMLSALGIMQGYEAGQEKNYVQVGDFLKAILGFLGETSSGDVVERARDAGLVSASDELVSNRVMKGGTAIEIAVRAAGYDEQYFGDIKNAINVSGITRGLSIGADKNLTNQDMAELLYRMIEAHPVEVEIKDGKAIYQINEDKTVLEKFKNIYLLKGIMSDNGITSLIGDTNIPEGCVLIDGLECKAEESARSYLGCSVKAYVRYDETQNEYTLLYLTENKNTSYQIDKQDIEEVDENLRSLTYTTPESFKAKRLRISGTVKVIYNGNAYHEYTMADIKNGSGKIVGIDNNDDGTVEVLKIFEPRLFFVESISKDKIMNRLTYAGDTFDIQDEAEIRYQVFKNGLEIKLSNVKRDDILLIEQPKSGKRQLVKMYVSDQKVTGAVTGFDEEDLKIKIDGTEYDISPAYFAAKADPRYVKPETGRNYTVYFDYYGKAVLAEKASDILETYGYLTRMYQDEDSDRYWVKLYGIDGIWKEYQLAKRAKYKDMTGDARVFEELTDENGKLQKAQMIKYRTNKDGEVKEIKTAQNSQTYLKDQFTQITVPDTDEYRYEIDAFIYNEVYLNADTVVMIVPKDVNDTDAFTIRDESYFGSGSNPCIAFDIDEWRAAPLVLVEYNEENAKSNIKGASYYLVESVRETIDEDDQPCIELDGYLGHYGRITVSDNGEGKFEGVKPGDILQFGTDTKSRANVCNRIYKLADGKTPLWTAPWSFNNSATALAGTVVDVNPDKRILAVNIDKEGAGLRYLQMNRVNSYQKLEVLIYDTKAQTVTEGSLNDLQKGDFVVARMAWYLISYIVIYR